MIEFYRAQSGAIKVVAACIVVLALIAAAVQATSWYLEDRILPGTSLGGVYVGALTRDRAAQRLQEAIDTFLAQGVQVRIDGTQEPLMPESVAFDLNISEAVDTAFRRGHEGGTVTRIRERVSSLWTDAPLPAPVRFDESLLRKEITDMADASSIARRDVRLSVNGTTVSLLTDTTTGKTVDQEDAVRQLTEALRTVIPASVTLQLIDDPPRADIATGPTAVDAASKILARPLTLAFEELQYSISRERIGTWITTTYDGSRIVADINREAVASYVTTIAESVNVPPEPPVIETKDGRVTGFTPPKVGRAVQEDLLVEQIVAVLADRAGKAVKGDVLTIPLKATKMNIVGLDGASGITELIGRATTPFTGSPKNRVSNIKNGVKFLTGTMIQPGEEFSTLGTLGVIDNTTGYLPELVIKGDRTVPEYGGGLCQVSTTLFRTALDAGLPITARRNHSFRISYYEKDGTGKFIGPGLDATIYEPDLDLKFLNDTGNPILIIGYVIGDKVTFELYGTKDGRSSVVTGPTILTETPAGEPVYIPTMDLPVGVTKQVEVPHPGGSTTASYTITYVDGTTKTQEFKSWYRRWPAKYLIGVESMPTPSPVSAFPSTPTQ
jgi:vancomycin resistance protein YoaR